MGLRKFFGTRLRSARLARGMTASILAEKIDVSPGRVSQLEAGETEPRDQTLSLIASTLELPEVHFYRPGVAPDGAPYWYRSTAAATKRARDSAEARHGWLRDMVSTIEGLVALPPVQIEAMNYPNPAVIRDVDIDHAAESVRSHWRLGEGPIPDTVALLENMGCVVASFAFGAETLDAFSQSPSERPYVLLNADERSSVRRRFNAAHELGHLILHRHVPQSLVSNSAIHKMMENQAHRFASELLFPASAIADEVYAISLDSMKRVKAKWKTSIQMILTRLRDLEIISQDKYEDSFREMSIQKRRTWEPLDDTIALEAPRLLFKAISLLLEQKVTTKTDLVHRFGYEPTDVEVLTGMPRGYLSSNDWGEVVELKLRASIPANAQPGGEVIPLRPRPSN